MHLIKVSQSGVEVTTSWTFGRSRWIFAAPAILQVDVIPGFTNSWRGAMIVIRDAGRVVRVGSHVPLDELQLIVAQMHEVLPLEAQKQRAETGASSSGDMGTAPTVGGA